MITSLGFTEQVGKFSVPWGAGGGGERAVLFCVTPTASRGVILLPPPVVSVHDKVPRVCCTCGTPERVAEVRVGVEGQSFHVSLNFGPALRIDPPCCPFFSCE